MTLKQKTSCLLCIMLWTGLVCLNAYTPPDSSRVKYNFNPGWRVTLGDVSGADQPGFNDAAWKEVTTPYAYNEDDAFRERMNGVYNGIGWYRPAGSDNRRLGSDGG